ncbi:MAG: protein-glutamate O-methyltransferase CheR [Pseudomonadota bacterium]
MPSLDNVYSSNIKPEDYDSFRQVLEEQCGILLGENKQYLVSSRLNTMLKAEGINSLNELNTIMKRQSNPILRQKVIDAMTTNETFWFRDIFPFDIFKDRILPELSEKPGSPTIWTAACSSGQETYSICISLDEYNSIAKKKLHGTKIIATDISEKVLKVATEGEYDQLSLSRGLSQVRLKKYFHPTQDNRWRVNSDIKQVVTFRYFNLLEKNYSLGKFDIIFCRNVLIYFSADLKAKVITKIADSLKPGGYLFLGASEAMSPTVADRFEMIVCHPGIVYRLK